VSVRILPRQREGELPCYASKVPAADSYSRAAHGAGISDPRTISTGSRLCRRSPGRLAIARWSSVRGSRPGSDLPILQRCFCE
jgi:hypothetical protein